MIGLPGSSTTPTGEANYDVSTGCSDLRGSVGSLTLKNWSLLYPDGVRAVLSPAYDLVSTIQYIPDDDLGLNLAHSKRFEDVTLASLMRLADKARVDVPVAAIVRETSDRIHAAWAELRADLPMSEAVKGVIEAHFRRVPVMRRD